MKQWYSAVLVLQSETTDSRTSLIEKSVRLLRAVDGDEAGALASQLGLELEHEYPNEAGHLVRWRFREVEDVYELDGSELGHGTAVYSRMCW